VIEPVVSPTRGISLSERLALLLWAFLLPACDPGMASSPEPGAWTTSRDSAGVTIVENTFPSGGLLDRWEVGPEPILNIGTLGGDPHFEFIRVDEGVRLSDGSLLVVDGRAMNVRVFDAEGEFVRWIGGLGQGPGEFQRVALLGVQPGDTVHFSDVGQGRVSRFTSEGEFLRTFRIQSEVRVFGLPAGVFRDGTILAKTVPHEDPGEEFDNVLQRLPIDYLGVDEEGRTVVEFGSLPGPEVAVGRELRGGGGSFNYSRGIPFGKVPATAVSWDRFFMGSADNYEILTLDRDGQLTHIIRLDHVQRPVTGEVRARLVEAHVSTLADPTEAPALREYYRDAHYPEFMPAYKRFLTDGVGNLWVEEYRPWFEGATEWLVFDASGRLSARVPLFPGFRVTDIGEHYIMGVFRDEFDVEYVQMYELKRRPA